MLSSYVYVSHVLRQTYIETMQPRPFEEWIEKGTQERKKERMGNIIKNKKNTLFKHHWKYFVRGGLIRTTTLKEQANNAVGRSTLPESSETLTHQ